jgi:hypothetical protein
MYIVTVESTMVDNARASREREPNIVFLYEVYDDRAAFEVVAAKVVRTYTRADPK